MTRPNGAIPFARVPPCLEKLAEARRWVGWRWESRRGGKPSKPPLTVIGGQANGYAENNVPATWATLADATAAFDAGQVEGVGLQLLKLSGFAAIDLDDVRGPNGDMRPWAADLIARSGSYAEWTPSGTGARIIGRVPKAHEPEHTAIEHPKGVSGGWPPPSTLRPDLRFRL